MKLIQKTAGLVMAVCLFALSSCADFFQGKVDMNPERDSSSGLFELLTKPEEITALEAPSELHISQGLYAGTITVSWSEVKYATSYQLERAVVEKPSADGTWKLPDETDFSVLSSFVYGTSYSDTVLSQPDYLSPEYGWRSCQRRRVFAQRGRKLPKQRSHKLVFEKPFSCSSFANSTIKIAFLAERPITATIATWK